MTFAAAKIIASVINPIMLLLTIVVSVRLYKANGNWRSYAFDTGLALITTYIVVHAIRDSHVIESLPWFPSGHETFAASAGTSLALDDRRWLFLVFPVLALLAVALVVAKYHIPIDIAGALVLSPPITLLCHRIRIEKAKSTV